MSTNSMYPKTLYCDIWKQIVSNKKLNETMKRNNTVN